MVQNLGLRESWIFIAQIKGPGKAPMLPLVFWEDKGDKNTPIHASVKVMPLPPPMTLDVEVESAGFSSGN